MDYHKEAVGLAAYLVSVKQDLRGHEYRNDGFTEKLGGALYLRGKADAYGSMVNMLKRTFGVTADEIDSAVSGRGKG